MSLTSDKWRSSLLHSKVQSSDAAEGRVHANRWARLVGYPDGRAAAIADDAAQLARAVHALKHVLQRETDLQTRPMGTWFPSVT